MASLYLRPDSPFLWMRYKDASGKWKSANTGYRKGNVGDERQADLLVREKTVQERATQRVNPGRASFEEWCPTWIEQRWGNKPQTVKAYRQRFRFLIEYLSQAGATHPSAVTRDLTLAYPAWRTARKSGWRKQKSSGTNTALYEIKFLAMMLDEAIHRGYARENPARRLGIAQTEHKHKTVWTDRQIEIALDAAEKSEPYGWIHVSLLMGKYQAVRLAQSAVPLDSIDLQRKVIRYPGSLMKGGRSYDQAIDPNFIPLLSEIVTHRRKAGCLTLCDLPKLPSLLMRRFLDALIERDSGFTKLSHHGLRATWITRAALNGVPETFAMRFVNHASTEVHKIYQQIGATDFVPYFERLHQ
jgi:hypothetical protein